MSFTVTVPASVLPVSIAEAKEHLRVEFADDDNYITALIGAAVDYVERHTRRALMPQTVLLTRDDFPDVIEPPLPPLQSVASISYIDTEGSPQTLNPSTYDIDNVSEPGRIVSSIGNQWPSTSIAINAVSVTFIAGYVDAASVPPQIKQAILLSIGHWYENREQVVEGKSFSELPMGVEALLNNYVIWL